MEQSTTKATLACSFEPNGSWFAFDTRTGRVVRRGFASRRQAEAWVSRQHDAR